MIPTNDKGEMIPTNDKGRWSHDPYNMKARVSDNNIIIKNNAETTNFGYIVNASDLCFPPKRPRNYFSDKECVTGSYAIVETDDAGVTLVIVNECTLMKKLLSSSFYITSQSPKFRRRLNGGGILPKILEQITSSDALEKYNILKNENSETMAFIYRSISKCDDLKYLSGIIITKVMWRIDHKQIQINFETYDNKPIYFNPLVSYLYKKLGGPFVWMRMERRDE